MQGIIQKDWHTTHVFQLCDNLGSKCLHPSHLFFHSLPSPTHLRRPIPIFHLLTSQTSPITWQWMTSPSRSSFWHLGWPQLELDTSLRLGLPWRASTWSWWSLSVCVSFFCVTTDHLPCALTCTHYKFCRTKDSLLNIVSETWFRKRLKKHEHQTMLNSLVLKAQLRNFSSYVRKEPILSAAPIINKWEYCFSDSDIEVTP